MAVDVAERVVTAVRDAGVLRRRNAEALGIAPKQLERLARAGRLERVSRGLYAAADAEPSELRTLAEAAARVPHGVLCLLSALRFHETTTQNPHEVWLAIDRKARRPTASGLPLRIVRFSGKALTTGIAHHQVMGVSLQVYCPAKTVADCFKYRNKIGLDVALEALRETWRQRRATMDELWHYAEICRVANVMRPYLESLV